MDHQCGAFIPGGQPFTPHGLRCRLPAWKCADHSDQERAEAQTYFAQRLRASRRRNYLLASMSGLLLLCCLAAGALKSMFGVGGSSNSAPSSLPKAITVTSTVTQTSRTTTSSPADAPYWSGRWLMNYWEDPTDCGPNNWHWVVQPGDSTDMYALRKGCFPGGWWAKILTHCKDAHLPEGTCAVWDPTSIMSEYRKRGNIEIIGLTQACLDRAGLDGFHQGPLHRDCVALPG